MGMGSGESWQFSAFLYGRRAGLANYVRGLAPLCLSLSLSTPPSIPGTPWPPLAPNRMSYLFYLLLVRVGQSTTHLTHL